MSASPLQPQPCSYHPHVETRLHCAECDRPICPKCMVQCEVGIKCPDCLKQRKSHLLDVQPIHFIKAGLGSVVLGYLSGQMAPYLPFGFWAILWFALSLRVIQWAVEQLRGWANQKRGSALSWVATFAFVVGVAFSITGSMVLGVTLSLTLPGFQLGSMLPFLLQLAWVITVGVQLKRGFSA